MKTKGIRIYDKENYVIVVHFSDILGEIQNGSLYYWSILFLEATGNLGENQSLPDFEKSIYQSQKGRFIS